MRTYYGLWLLFFCITTTLSSQDLGETYILEWKKFYPSKALKSGMRPSTFHYEDRSADRITRWLEYNERILLNLSEPNVNIDPIDGRLLRVQVQSEVDNWSTLSGHTTSLTLYSRLISNAVPSIFKADYLLPNEKSALLCKRYAAIEQLAIAAQSNLKKVTKSNLEKGLKDLEKTLDYLENDLFENNNSHRVPKTCEDSDNQLDNSCRELGSRRRAHRSRGTRAN